MYAHRKLRRGHHYYSLETTFTPHITSGSRTKNGQNSYIIFKTKVKLFLPVHKDHAMKTCR